MFIQRAAAWETIMCCELLSTLSPGNTSRVLPLPEWALGWASSLESFLEAPAARAQREHGCCFLNQAGGAQGAVAGTFGFSGCTTRVRSASERKERRMPWALPGNTHPGIFGNAETQNILRVHNWLYQHEEQKSAALRSCPLNLSAARRIRVS